MSKSFADAIAECELASTKKEKFEALSGIDFSEQRLIWEAFNPYRMFHVKQWEEPDSYSDEDPSICVFYSLLDDLASLRITGNAAREAVTETLGKYTEFTAGYLARVLRKDLDCGAARKTFEAVYSKLRIPKFELMLAKKIDDPERDIRFPCWAEVKYDGLRVVAFVGKKSVMYYTRKGKPAEFLEGVFDAEILGKCKDVVLDGEVIGSSFSDAMQAKGSKHDKNSLRYVVFDMLDPDSWVAQKSNVSQLKRTAALSCLEGKGRVVKAEGEFCDSVGRLQAYYGRVVDAGFEGLVVKDPNAFYEWDRSKAWLKFKPVWTFDLVVKKAWPGKGRLSGTLGTMWCEGYDENGKFIEVAVGGGYSDEERDKFWRMFLAGKMVGKTIEVEGRGMTKAKNSDSWSLRHPVFVRVREDK